MVSTAYQSPLYRRFIIDCQKRTNLGFRNRSILNHHREYSLLEQLPIDMVDDFVTSDDLDLLHLGIMKKMFADVEGWKT